MFAHILKANPYRDAEGQFTTREKDVDGAAEGTSTGSATLDKFAQEFAESGRSTSPQWIFADTDAYMQERGFSQEEAKLFREKLEAHTRDHTQASADKEIQQALSEGGRYQEYLHARVEMEEAILDAKDKGWVQKAKNIESEVRKDMEEDIRLFGAPSGYSADYDGPLPEWMDEKVKDATPKHTPWRDVTVYRLGDADKDVLSTTLDPRGANIGNSRLKPDHQWSIKEMYSKGYRVVAGFGANYGYDTEREALFLKMTTRKADGFMHVLKNNPYRDAEGQFTTKEKDARGSVEISESNGWVKIEAKNGAGAKVGQMDLSFNEASNSYQIRESHVNADAQGQGFGQMLYRNAIDFAVAKGKGLHSDTAVSASADRVWQKLKDQGFPVERHPEVELDEGLNKFYSLKVLEAGGMRIPMRSGVPVWRMTAPEKAQKMEGFASILKGYTPQHPPVAKPKAGGFMQVMKANPYHDALGRFTTREGANFVSLWAKSKVPLKANPVAAAAGRDFIDCDPDRGDAGWVNFNKFKAQHQEFINTQLTESERMAIGKYTGSAYRVLNEDLRRDGTTKTYLQATKDGLDSALDKTTLGRDMVLYRGLEEGDYPDRLKELFNKGELLPGTVLSDPAYSSATPKEKMAADWGQGGAMFKIRAPKEHKGLYVDTISENQGEYETLLPRNTTLVVTKAYLREFGTYYKKPQLVVEVDMVVGKYS